MFSCLLGHHLDWWRSILAHLYQSSACEVLEEEELMCSLEEHLPVLRVGVITPSHIDAAVVIPVSGRLLVSF